MARCQSVRAHMYQSGIQTFGAGAQTFPPTGRTAGAVQREENWGPETLPTAGPAAQMTGFPTSGEGIPAGSSGEPPPTRTAQCGLYPRAAFVGAGGSGMWSPARQDGLATIPCDRVSTKPPWPLPLQRCCHKLVLGAAGSPRRTPMAEARRLAPQFWTADLTLHVLSRLTSTSVLSLRRILAHSETVSNPVSSGHTLSLGESWKP